MAYIPPIPKEVFEGALNTPFYQSKEWLDLIKQLEQIYNGK